MLDKVKLLELHPEYNGVSGPWLNQTTGRLHVTLYKVVNYKHFQTTLTLARALMEVKLGRKLESYEEVDHIDEDRTNDSIDNLQLLSSTENVRKQHGYDNDTPQHQELVCPKCSKKFVLPTRVIRARLKARKSNKSVSDLCCSNNCSRNYNQKRI